MKTISTHSLKRVVHISPSLYSNDFRRNKRFDIQVFKLISNTNSVLPRNIDILLNERVTNNSSVGMMIQEVVHIMMKFNCRGARIFQIIEHGPFFFFLAVFCWNDGRTSKGGRCEQNYLECCTRRLCENFLDALKMGESKLKASTKPLCSWLSIRQKQTLLSSLQSCYPPWQRQASVCTVQGSESCADRCEDRFCC